MVGREQELEELKRYLDSAAKGNGLAVFVSGEAGAGKSRLIKEFLSRAKKQGIPVLAGWCLPNSGVPYFPFVEAFNSYFSTFEEEQEIGLQQPGTPVVSVGEASQTYGLDVTQWLTGSRPINKIGKPEAISPQVWKDQAFVAVIDTLHKISLQEPKILVTEDIHWADSASLALLHYIARAISSEKILLLATLRSDELTSDAEGHPHPLAEEMRLMKREDLFAEIKLSNLKQTGISAIAENMMGGSVQPDLIEKLEKESKGNALFVVESLRMLFEHKGLVQENDQWRLVVDELGIPSKVKDIILRRLAILNYAQRRVLDAASVIGEKFSVELLSAVLGQERLDVLESLNIIAQSTSIVNDEEAFYRFDHARSREVLYEALSLSLKKGYHSRVAERIESSGKDGKIPNADLAYPAWSLFVVGYQQCMFGQYEKGIATVLRSISLYNDLKDFRSQMEAYFSTLRFCPFGTCKLDQEGRDSLLKVIEIDDRFKMANYIQLIPAYAFLSLNFQRVKGF